MGVSLGNDGTSIDTSIHVSLVLLHALLQSHSPDIKLKQSSFTFLIFSLSTGPVILIPLQLYKAVDRLPTHWLINNLCNNFFCCRMLSGTHFILMKSSLLLKLHPPRSTLMLLIESKELATTLPAELMVNWSKGLLGSSSSKECSNTGSSPVKYFAPNYCA